MLQSVSKLTKKAQEKKAREEYEEDMMRAEILGYILLTSFDRAEEDRCLKSLRQIKSQYGARYLPSHPRVGSL
jgi:hypothetical protein